MALIFPVNVCFFKHGSAVMTDNCQVLLEAIQISRPVTYAIITSGSYFYA